MVGQAFYSLSEPVILFSDTFGKKKNHRLEWLRHCATEKSRTQSPPF